MTKVYITSDSHFFHKNIIQYENRPFGSVEEMNEVMIKNWNKVVSKEDKIFHLGDFAFSNKEKTLELVSKLNGYKILILGNHDKRRNIQFYRDVGFNEVYKWSIIYSEWYILSHSPIYVNENMPYINIDGHIHNKEMVGLNKNQKNSYINVCVEKANYTPVLFADLMKSFKETNEECINRIKAEHFVEEWEAPF
jgi:calcineurin-like phosphoesterase family protein